MTRAGQNLYKHVLFLWIFKENSLFSFQGPNQWYVNMKHTSGAKPFPSPNIVDLIDPDILFDKESKADFWKIVHFNKTSAEESQM